MDGNQWRHVQAELKRCFKRSFEGSQGGRITDGIRYIAPIQVAGAESANECL